MRNYNNNALDVFRIIATAQVFFGHVITHFSIPNSPDRMVYFVRGVPILFVLCGFLAAKSLEGRQVKKWLLGRAARIFPAFWVCIIVNTIIIAFLYNVKPTFKESAIYFITQFAGLNFYTGDWLRGYGVGTPNGVLWTIIVQVQFFLIAPLVHKYLKNKSLKNWIGYIAGFSLLSIVCNRASEFLPEIAVKLLDITVVPYLYFLLFGMMMWYHKDTIIPNLEKERWVILICYIAWKHAENHLGFPHVLDGVLYNTITTLLIASLIAAFGFVKRIRVKRDYTYGFYLYHMVFINIAVEKGFKSLMPLWKGTMIILIIAICSLLTAWLSKRFIETPLNDIIRRKFD